MSRSIPKPRKGETRKNYRNRLVGGTSWFNRQTDHLKIRDTSEDDFIFDGKKFVKSD